MQNWLLWLVVGILSLVAGFVALMNPMAATLTAEQVAGWAFLFIGILQVISAFRAEGFGAKIWAALLGAVGVILGIMLLGNPLHGVVTLTIVVATLFLGLGIAKILASFSLRGTPFFWPVLISGALSVLLAIMIFGNFPASLVATLGILLAVELISNGVATIALALSSRR